MAPGMAPAPAPAAAMASAPSAAAVVVEVDPEVEAAEAAKHLAAEKANERAAKKALAAAIKVATVAAKTLATLAKDNIVNMLMITEEGGIQPLVDLLRTKAHSYENPTKALWHLAANEDNQTAIARAGGIVPLVALLSSDSDITAQYAAAALESLARDHTENVILLARAGAIAPLVDLLGSDSSDTQEHAVGALLSLASSAGNDQRNAVVEKLVGLLDVRNAAAQMKAAEALAVLAARSEENRKAITNAKAIDPLVRILGDGRRTRSETPQERAAAVLVDLARLSDNKKTIVAAGGINPLVAMLSSDSPEVQKNAAGALWQLAALGNNRSTIAEAGAIKPLVTMLNGGSPEAQKFATGALYHLASSADNKVVMVNAGAIPLLVAVLHSKNSEAREYAAGVVSTLARTQGGNKKAIFKAGGIKPLTDLLDDSRSKTIMHAACALWGLSDGKDGVYDKQIAEAGAIPRLISVLQGDDPETRGFAVACLKCICMDDSAKGAVLEAGGADLLTALAYGPATWLRGQAVEMLKLLGQEVPDAEDAPPLHLKMPSMPITTTRTRRAPGPDGIGPPPEGMTASGTARRQMLADAREDPHQTSRVSDTSRVPMSARPLSARMKFHFFSFQIYGTTGVSGHK